MSQKQSDQEEQQRPTTKIIPNRVALHQFHVTDHKPTNILTASRSLQDAASRGVHLSVLPEIWNSPYATSAFPDYAEFVPDVGMTLSNVHFDDDDNWESTRMMMECAMNFGMFIVGGSIPERVDDDARKKSKYYNTCVVVDPDGRIVAKHRKVHLFDIDVPGRMTFKESDTLTAGEKCTVFDGGEALGMIGVGICYDIRFPEYALLLCQKHSCNILIYPGAFNLTTGPAHWELLQRARAVDNQCFVLTASQARTLEQQEEDDGDGEKKNKKKYPHYTAWGHSTAVSPWGEVLATSDENEALVVLDLDLTKVKEMREGIPTKLQKRHDIYQVVDGKE